ncbi:SRPBCC family protein [Synechococcus sp. PCC 7336]|uniref:SRPBCC family protein n=1 Tax=Synechococcus sp. PCC 7336 TaxID=195250 RepID=UPI00034B017B|nr:SRPBCC family protein [Synechococcus sp. PCC 7336]
MPLFNRQSKADPELADAEELEADLDEAAELEDANGFSSEEGSPAVAVNLEKLEGRRRCLQAAIEIEHSPQAVWDVLIDYEGLADFIPNLAESCVVGEEDGCVLLRQVGVQKLSVLKFSAAVTLKMDPSPIERIDFSMTEGDLLEFAGSWQLAAIDDSGTKLSYCVTILPPRKMPVQIVQRRLRKDLSANLLAIQAEVEKRASAVV